METLKSLKNRMSSIRSTMQITKSMQLISQTKVQTALKRLGQNRAHREASLAQVQALRAFYEGGTSPYFEQLKQPESAVILVLSGERGLCGAYNINVCKEAYAQGKKFKQPHYIALGSKGKEFLARRKKRVDGWYRSASEVACHLDAQEVSHSALSLFYKGQADCVLLVYTEYLSMLSQRAKTVQLLPVPAGGVHPKRASGLMLYEPDAAGLYARTIPAYMAAMVYGAMLESAVCEQSARIMSMGAAVKNCSEMLDTLSLRYNRMRQSKITQELTEITGGSEALDSAEEE